ncbi:MAG TPA: hypothetical protein VNO26_07580 [Candidatus Limnocylindria bacterium]|nr:hypothetical protein [Candidatus Limnocylindria bacterium]
MTLDLRVYLDQIALAHAGDPLGYLWEFAPVYAWWHRERARGAQPIGFLTFHRLVIRSFRRSFPGGWIPVQPSSMLPFPLALADQGAAVGDLDALAAYSADLEAWHHGVHRLIDAFGAPERNVLARAFWEFHVFLDQQFAQALEAWGTPWSVYLAQVSHDDQRRV